VLNQLLQLSNVRSMTTRGIHHQTLDILDYLVRESEIKHPLYRLAFVIQGKSWAVNRQQIRNRLARSTSQLHSCLTRPTALYVRFILLVTLHLRPPAPRYRSTTECLRGFLSSTSHNAARSTPHYPEEGRYDPSW
jgi:hypothetical protein